MAGWWRRLVGRVTAAPTVEYLVLDGYALWDDAVGGAWCPVCQAPCAVHLPVVGADPDTLLVEARIEVRACEECGWQDASLLTP